MSGRRGAWIFGLALVAVLALVVIVGGRPGDDSGEALSPTSTGANGAKAMVELLEHFGSEVQAVTGAPPADAEVAVLLEDRLDDVQRDDLDRWVRQGGTLVVADPRSTFTPQVVGQAAGLVSDQLDAGDCDIEALAAAERIHVGGGFTYEVPEGARSCFGDGNEAFVVETERDAGTVVAVGGVAPFTNGLLAEEDDAVLVADLVAPDPPQRVAFLEPPEPVLGEGDKTLADLVPVRVEQALAQLAIAFLAYVWFRARRAGRPVLEPQPTQLAGSELVAAVGELLQQRRDPGRAAAELRADLRRQIAQRIGLPADADPEAVAEAAARQGADPERVRAALDDARPVQDDAELVRLAREIDAIRQEILHVHSR